MYYFPDSQDSNSKNPYIFPIPPKNISEFTIMEKLGEEVHGSVYRAKHKGNGKTYALKIINQEYFQNKENNPKRREGIDYIIKNKEINYLREKTILYNLTKMNYSHVIKLYADFEDSKSRYLVMELVEGKKLENIIDMNSNNGYISENIIINILTQLLEILKYLHDTVHIIHRNIKPDTIILGPNNQIKLLDFGFAAYLVNDKVQLVSNRSIKGDLCYAPPEIIFPSRYPQYDYKIDIFSLGFTIYSLMNPSKNNKLNLPQDTKNSNGKFERININLINSFYSNWLIKFVELLYSKNPAERPTAKGALILLKELQNNPNKTLIYKDLKKENNKSNKEILNTLLQRAPEIPLTISINNTLVGENKKMLNNNKNKGNNINDIQNTNQLKNNEEYLQPKMGTDNKILTSIESIFRILYRLDLLKYIEEKFQSMFQNYRGNIKDLFIYKFHEMLEATKKYEEGQINKNNYEQMLTNFMKNLFIKNSSGFSGIRPIILFYMMFSVFKDEFSKYFSDIYQNNIFDSIIKNNYSPFNCILPMNNNTVYKTINSIILNFKSKYKGPFVDNFCFVLLCVSKCPKCSNLFGISKSYISEFLQLDVPYNQNNLINIINDYFSQKINDGNYECSNCGTKGKKARQILCLNLPNYLLLEFEDKNTVIFSDIISIPLYDGKQYKYQYVASIYKKKVNSITSFVSVIKTNKGYDYCSDECVQQCSQKIVNSENPSLALYKKVKN